MSLFPLLAGLLAAQAPAPTIQINPLLIVQADEIWSVIGRSDNRVWPGWDARKTPIMIYFPGRQDLLINHPKPPAGFVRYEGPVRSKAGAIYLRDGKTLFDLDGQNTAVPVGGVETLVVADSLSTRRQWAEGLAPAIVTHPERADAIVGDSLVANPYPQMVMFAHEAFHVYQNARAPHKSPHELDLAQYPSLNVENNVGFALEADALSAALRSKDESTLRQEALRWLAVRMERRRTLPEVAWKYEDAAEFEEGLAKYVEYRTLQVMEGRHPSSAMWLVQGFHGYDGLASERAHMVKDMEGYLKGENGVNADLYGASPARFRLYFSGMAIGALLDRLGANWHDRIFQEGTSLTSLATEALRPTPEALSGALTEVRARGGYPALVEAKTKLAQDGATYVEKAVEAFDTSPGELVIDYSGLRSSAPSFAYTPFGILRVDDDRNLFRLVPIRGEVGGAKFSEDGNRAVLHDRKTRTIRLQLTAAPTDARGGLLQRAALSLPGVSLENVTGRMVIEGHKVTIRLSDSPSLAIRLS